jgi:hypothetical protein
MDLSAATIVTLYLETSGVLRLVETLRAQMRPGTRIVSRSAPIYGWEPDRSETFKEADGTPTVLFLWTIPGAENASHEGEVVSPELPQSQKVGK